MIRVFSAPVAVQAHIVRGALEAEGISAEVRGEERTSLAGGLPLDACYAEVWVPDRLAGAASEVVARLTSSHHVGGLSLVTDETSGGGELSLCGDWLCACGESNPRSFELCWACARPWCGEETDDSEP